MFQHEDKDKEKQEGSEFGLTAEKSVIEIPRLSDITPNVQSEEEPEEENVLSLQSLKSQIKPNDNVLYSPFEITQREQVSNLIRNANVIPEDIQKASDDIIRYQEQIANEFDAPSDVGGFGLNVHPTKEDVELIAKRSGLARENNNKLNFDNESIFDLQMFRIDEEISQLPNFKLNDRDKISLPPAIKQVSPPFSDKYLKFEPENFSKEINELDKAFGDFENSEFAKEFIDNYLPKYQHGDLNLPGFYAKRTEEEINEDNLTNAFMQMYWDKYYAIIEKHGLVPSVTDKAEPEFAKLVKSSGYANATPEDKVNMLYAYHKIHGDKNISFPEFKKAASDFVYPKLSAIRAKAMEPLLRQSVINEFLKDEGYKKYIEESGDEINSLTYVVYKNREATKEGKRSQIDASKLHAIFDFLDDIKYSNFTKFRESEKGFFDQYRNVRDVTKHLPVVSGIVDYNVAKHINEVLFSVYHGKEISELDKIFIDSFSSNREFFGNTEQSYREMVASEYFPMLTSFIPEFVGATRLMSFATKSMAKGIAKIGLKELEHSIARALSSAAKELPGVTAKAAATQTAKAAATQTPSLLSRLTNFQSIPGWSDAASKSFSKALQGLTVKSAAESTAKWTAKSLVGAGLAMSPRVLAMREDRLRPEFDFYFSDKDEDKYKNIIASEISPTEALLKSYLYWSAEFGSELLGESLFKYILKGTGIWTKDIAKYAAKKGITKFGADRLRNIIDKNKDFLERYSLNHLATRYNKFRDDSYVMQWASGVINHSAKRLNSIGIQNLGVEIAEEWWAERVQNLIWNEHDDFYSMPIATLYKESIHSGEAFSPLYIMSLFLSGISVGAKIVGSAIKLNRLYKDKVVFKKIIDDIKNGLLSKKTLLEYSRLVNKINDKNLSRTAFKILGAYEKFDADNNEYSADTFEKWFSEYEKENDEYNQILKDVADGKYDGRLDSLKELANKFKNKFFSNEITPLASLLFRYVIGVSEGHVTGTARDYINSFMKRKANLENAIDDYLNNNIAFNFSIIDEELRKLKEEIKDSPHGGMEVFDIIDAKLKEAKEEYKRRTGISHFSDASSLDSISGVTANVEIEDENSEGRTAKKKIRFNYDKATGTYTAENHDNEQDILSAAETYIEQLGIENLFRAMHFALNLDSVIPKSYLINAVLRSVLSYLNAGANNKGFDFTKVHVETLLESLSLFNDLLDKGTISDIDEGMIKNISDRINNFKEYIGSNNIDEASVLFSGLAALNKLFSNKQINEFGITFKKALDAMSGEQYEITEDDNIEPTKRKSIPKRIFSKAAKFTNVIEQWLLSLDVGKSEISFSEYVENNVAVGSGLYKFIESVKELTKNENLSISARNKIYSIIMKLDPINLNEIHDVKISVSGQEASSFDKDSGLLTISVNSVNQKLSSSELLLEIAEELAHAAIYSFSKRVTMANSYKSGSATYSIGEKQKLEIEKATGGIRAAIEGIMNNSSRLNHHYSISLNNARNKKQIHRTESDIDILNHYDKFINEKILYLDGKSIKERFIGVGSVKYYAGTFIEDAYIEMAFSRYMSMVNHGYSSSKAAYYAFDKNEYVARTIADQLLNTSQSNIVNDSVLSGLIGFFVDNILIPMQAILIRNAGDMNDNTRQKLLNLGDKLFSDNTDALAIISWRRFDGLLSLISKDSDSSMLQDENGYLHVEAILSNKAAQQAQEELFELINQTLGGEVVRGKIIAVSGTKPALPGLGIVKDKKGGYAQKSGQISQTDLTDAELLAKNIKLNSYFIIIDGDKANVLEGSVVRKINSDNQYMVIDRKLKMHIVDASMIFNYTDTDKNDAKTVADNYSESLTLSANIIHKLEVSISSLLFNSREREYIDKNKRRSQSDFDFVFSYLIGDILDSDDNILEGIVSRALRNIDASKRAGKRFSHRDANDYSKFHLFIREDYIEVSQSLNRNKPFRISGDKTPLLAHPVIARMFKEEIDDKNLTLIDSFAGSGVISRFVKKFIPNFFNFKSEIVKRFGEQDFIDNVANYLNGIKDAISGIEDNRELTRVVRNYLNSAEDRDAALYIANNIAFTGREVYDTDKLFFDKSLFNETSIKRIIEQSEKDFESIVSMDGWETHKLATNSSAIMLDPPYHKSKGNSSAYKTAGRNVDNISNLSSFLSKLEVAGNRSPIIYTDEYHQELEDYLLSNGFQASVFKRKNTSIYEIIATRGFDVNITDRINEYNNNIPSSVKLLEGISVPRFSHREIEKTLSSVEATTKALEMIDKNKVVIDRVYLEESPDIIKKAMGNGFMEIKLEDESVGGILLEEIDNEKNVVKSVFVNEERRKIGIAKKAYLAAAIINGDIKSGEFRNDMLKTSFVSDEARKLWESLNRDFDIKKIPIQGNKFRFQLTRESVSDAYHKAKANNNNHELIFAVEGMIGNHLLSNRFSHRNVNTRYAVPHIDDLRSIRRIVNQLGYTSIDDITKNLPIELRNQIDESNAQIDEVKKQYPNTRIAPNGKISNLTEEQWLLVRTPNFIKWSGDWMNGRGSILLDENGEPKVLYHWTNQDKRFQSFIELQGLYDYGIHIGHLSHALGRMEMRDKKGHMIPLFVRTGKTLHIEKDLMNWNLSTVLSELNITGQLSKEDFRRLSLEYIHVLDNHKLKHLSSEDLMGYIRSVLSDLGYDSVSYINQIEIYTKEINELKKQMNTIDTANSDLHIGNISIDEFFEIINKYDDEVTIRKKYNKLRDERLKYEKDNKMYSYMILRSRDVKHAIENIGTFGENDMIRFAYRASEQDVANTIAQVSALDTLDAVLFDNILMSELLNLKIDDSNTNFSRRYSYRGTNQDEYVIHFSRAINQKKDLFEEMKKMLIEVSDQSLQSPNDKNKEYQKIFDSWLDAHIANTSISGKIGINKTNLRSLVSVRIEGVNDAINTASGIIDSINEQLRTNILQDLSDARVRLRKRLSGDKSTGDTQLDALLDRLLLLSKKYTITLSAHDIEKYIDYTNAKPENVELSELTNFIEEHEREERADYIRNKIEEAKKLSETQIDEDELEDKLDEEFDKERLEEHANNEKLRIYKAYKSNIAMILINSVSDKIADINPVLYWFLKFDTNSRAFTGDGDILHEIKMYQKWLQLAQKIILNRGNPDEVALVSNNMFKFLNELHATNVYLKFMDRYDENWIKYLNKRMNDSMAAAYLQPIGRLKSMNLQKLLLLMDGFSKEGASEFVNELTLPLNLNNQTLRKTIYEELSEMKLLREKLTDAQNSLAGIAWLVFQKPTFDLTAKNSKLIDRLSEEFGADEISDFLNNPDNLKLSSKNPNHEIYYKFLIKEFFIPAIKGSIEFTFGEVPNGFAEEDVQRSIMEMSTTFDNSLVLDLGAMSDYMKKNKSFKIIYKHKDRADVLSLTGANSIGEVIDYMVEIGEEEFFDTHTIIGDFVKKSREKLRKLKDGEFTSGLSLRYVSEIITNDEFNEIDDYAPIIRYKTLDEFSVLNVLEETEAGKTGEAENMYRNHIYSDININNKFIEKRKNYVSALRVDAFSMLLSRFDQQMFYIQNEAQKQFIVEILKKPYFAKDKKIEGDSGWNLETLNNDWKKLIHRGFEDYFNRGKTRNRVALRKNVAIRNLQNIMNNLKILMLGAAQNSAGQLSAYAMTAEVMEGSLNNIMQDMTLAIGDQAAFLNENSDEVLFLNKYAPEIITRGLPDFDIPGATDLLKAKNLYRLLFIPKSSSGKGFIRDFLKNMTDGERMRQINLIPMAYQDRIAARTAFFALYRNKIRQLGEEYDLNNPNLDAVNWAMAMVRMTHHSDNELNRPLISNAIDLQSDNLIFNIPFLTVEGDSGSGNAFMELLLQSKFAFKSFSLNEKTTMRLIRTNAYMSLLALADSAPLESMNNEDREVLLNNIKSYFVAAAANMTGRAAFHAMKYGFNYVSHFSASYAFGSDGDDDLLEHHSRVLEAYMPQYLLIRFMYDYFGLHELAQAALLTLAINAEKVYYDDMPDPSSIDYMSMLIGDDLALGSSGFLLDVLTKNSRDVISTTSDILSVIQTKDKFEPHEYANMYRSLAFIAASTGRFTPFMATWFSYANQFKKYQESYLFRKKHPRKTIDLPEYFEPKFESKDHDLFLKELKRKKQ